MSEWRTGTVESCLVRLALNATPKLQTQGYLSSGRYPVVDQGKTLIAGWTNNESGLITTCLPVVVFGDHTRAFKYVDFPFVRGADGTQVLKPKLGIDPLFFFYALRAIDFPSRGYNRHFKELKQKEIAFPLEEEQRDIAHVLRLVENARSLQVAQIHALERCKRTAMQILFTRGLRGEVQQQSEIGLVPESWEVSPLETRFLVVSGGTPSRDVASYWENGKIPWVKTTEVNYCTISSTEECITEDSLKNSAAKLLPAGTLLMAMYGQGITRGKVAVLGIEAACNQACAAMRPLSEAVVPRYLYHFLTYRYDEIRLLAHGGQQQNLNLEIVRGLPIAWPPDAAEQDEIAAALDVIDRKIDLQRRKRSVLDDLFKALLHKLMNGEIRVGQLDLSVLSSAAHREAAE
jgi:type I restriction enzyme S subunit